MHKRLQQLYDEHKTVIAAIKAIRTEFQLDLGEAKQRVNDHPAWTRKVTAAKPLHDELIRHFNMEADDDGRRLREFEEDDAA